MADRTAAFPGIVCRATPCTMHLFLFVLTLLVALCTSSGGAEKCPASRATNFTFSVASRRNLTGHWIVSVDANTEHPKLISQQNTSRGIAVEVGQKTASCDTSENLQLTATATVSDVATPVSAVATRTPPAGYEVVNGLGYYKMHAVAVTWTEARDKCVQEGAHLIILNSDQEAEVVKTYFDRKPSVPNDGNSNLLFAGFHDQDKEGEFVTVLGEPLSSTGYTKWHPGEPDGKATENCGTLHRYSSNLGLVDTICNAKLSFICEYSIY